jgi:hypothetical protein
MAYGNLKVDSLIYDNSGSDVTISISALAGAGSAAGINSPTFTGIPAAPTASSGTNTTQIATTAFVTTGLATKLPLAGGTLTGGLTGTSASFSGAVTADSYKTPAQAVSALAIDLATGNYFTKTIAGNSTFTFTNPPASGTVGSFTLELTHSSGTVAWPASVKWPADTAPTLTAGKTHLFIFVTDDGGTRYRGAALADYVN